MTYGEFWAHYLAAHSEPRCRALHYAGTLTALGLLAHGVLTADRRSLVAAPIVGYGAAWFGHFAFEGNRPATFGHPLWSALSDFRMLGLFLTGQLGTELHSQLLPEERSAKKDERRTQNR